jgi:hypothetical protein
VRCLTVFAHLSAAPRTVRRFTDQRIPSAVIKRWQRSEARLHRDNPPTDAAIGFSCITAAQALDIPDAPRAVSVA